MVASDDQWSRQVFIDHRDARFADRDPNDGGEWTRRELPFWSLTRIRASQFVVGFAPDPPGRIWSLFLLVQLSGHCTVISGHRRRELDRGAWSWVDPGKASEIRSEGLEQIVVEVPRCLLSGGKAVEQLVRQVPVGGTSVAASILPVATELFEQGMGHTEANCLALLEALARLTVVASGGLGALNAISATAYRLMSSAHRMIETTWPDPDFNAVSMAKALGVSRRTLDELFGRCGLTAEKAIRLRRIKEGARLLGAEVERMVLADVALRCGFADQSSFSKAFKHHYGLTPGQYRRDGSRALSQRGG